MKGISNTQKPIYTPQLARHTSQGSSQLMALRAQLRSLTLAGQQKQKQAVEMSTKLRNQGIKNRKLKMEVCSAEEKINIFIQTQAQVLLSRNKNQKQSPLFYNESGLSPFELVKIGESKFEDMSEKNICMICYRDLEMGIKIMKLPCAHLLHKECAIQHLLYSKQCPACMKNLK